jgi:D-alanyl-D-alanine carboxypeptidase (penicillin-binding protein 5/6)
VTARGVRRVLPVVAAVCAAAAAVGSIGGLAAAGSRSTPPPTPVGPDASPSPFVTELRTPADPVPVPAVDAAAAILVELDTGQVLFARDPRERRPIASLTKIMTALIVLRRTEPDDIVTVSAAAAAPDGSNGLSELGIVEGERVTVRDLTYALLLQSANDAAIALAEHVSGSVRAFVRLMNRTARRLGMRDTDLRSPNGLDDAGYSTARDLALLARAAFAEPAFARVARTRFHEVPAPEGDVRRIQNRNVLLWLYPGALGGKTGYTRAAGFCLVAAAERGGRRLAVVVLGAPGEPFSGAAALLDHGLAAFEEVAFVVAGEPLGAVELVGGWVPAEAGDGLTALVPVDASGDATRRVVVDPGAAYPPAPGEAVGVLRVSVPGRSLGAVPVVVSAVPPPPPADGRPWWERAAGAVAGAAGRAIGGLLD